MCGRVVGRGVGAIVRHNNQVELARTVDFDRHREDDREVRVFVGFTILISAVLVRVRPRDDLDGGDARNLGQERRYGDERRVGEVKHLATPDGVVGDADWVEVVRRHVGLNACFERCGLLPASQV